MLSSPGLYLVNPRSPVPSYTGGEVYAADGSSPATLIADLALATVAALAPAHWHVRLGDEQCGPIDLAPAERFVGLTGKVNQWPRARELAAHYRALGKVVVIGTRSRASALRDWNHARTDGPVRFLTQLSIDLARDDEGAAETIASPLATNIVPLGMTRAELVAGVGRLALDLYAPQAFEARLMRHLALFGRTHTPAFAVGGASARAIDLESAELIAAIARIGQPEAAMLARIARAARARGSCARLVRAARARGSCARLVRALRPGRGSRGSSACMPMRGTCSTSPRRSSRCAAWVRVDRASAPRRRERAREYTSAFGRSWSSVSLRADAVIQELLA